MGNVVTNYPNVSQIWEWLAQVPDPEIPVISVVDLGIVREVKLLEVAVEVTVTPTYSGCPATQMIANDIETALQSRGIDNLVIKTQIAPAWTTDWLSPAGREKLERYGIAPPEPAGGPKYCPLCTSKDVEKISQFGSTPCKAQWRCRSCLEPFDYFKCF